MKTKVNIKSKALKCQKSETKKRNIVPKNLFDSYCSTEDENFAWKKGEFIYFLTGSSRIYKELKKLGIDVGPFRIGDQIELAFKIPKRLWKGIKEDLEIQEVKYCKAKDKCGLQQLLETSKMMAKLHCGRERHKQKTVLKKVC